MENRRLLFLVCYALGITLVAFVFAGCSPQPDTASQPVATPTSTKVSITNQPIQVTSPAQTTPPLTPLDVQNRAGQKPLPTNLVDQAKQEWISILDQEKKQWLAKNVSSYQLRVSVEDTSFKPVRIFSILVKNNNIVQKDNQFTPSSWQCCERYTPDTRLADFDANKYTISGLFNIAYDQINNYWNDEIVFYVEFDPEYHIPNFIHLNNDNQSDVQRIWKIEEFQEITS